MKENAKILVPVDGSATAGRAAEFAAEFAASTGASIDLLFVTAFDGSEENLKQKERFLPVDVLVSSMQNPDDVFAEAKKHIPDGIAVACHKETGDAAETILRFSKEHDHELIIIGSKGMSAVQNFLLGSVSQKIMEEAGVSVLIVK